MSHLAGFILRCGELEPLPRRGIYRVAERNLRGQAGFVAPQCVRRLEYFG